MLAMAFSACLFSRGGVIRPEEVQHITGFEFSGFVSYTILIDQERKIDSRHFAEEAGVICVSHADCGQTRSDGFEFCLVFAQLRDVLTAEDSPIMAKKHDYRRVLFPKRTEAYFAAGCIGQNDRCKPFRKRRHVFPSLQFKSFRGIDGRGAPRWQITGERGDGNQSEGHGAIRQRVNRTDLK